MKIVSPDTPRGVEPGGHELSDWVDPYLSNQLRDDQRDRFEQVLVADPKLQELTRQAYVLQQLSVEFPEQLAPASNRWRAPVLHYAMAASLGAALVALPAWWVQHELRQQQGTLAVQLDQAQRSVAALAQPQAGLAILRLGVTRSSDGQSGLISQTSGVRWAQLQLPTDAPAGGSWPDSAEVIVKADGGDQRWRYRMPDLQLNGEPALLFPLAGVPPGGYEVQVIDQGQALARYRFELAGAE